MTKMMFGLVSSFLGAGLLQAKKQMVTEKRICCKIS
jgi:hypothetical protein